MSLKGEVEAVCPKGCEPFTTEIWSFIRGDKDTELRERVLWRECNLILCPQCNVAFVPAVPYIYFDAKAELLVFVFPLSFADKESFWREKMHADYLQMKVALGGKNKAVFEPRLFFGPEGLAKLLEDEDYRDEEREVMEVIAAELGLGVYRISPSFARERGTPSALPCSSTNGKQPTKAAVVNGLERLLAENDRLEGCQKALDALRDPKEALWPAAAIPD